MLESVIVKREVSVQGKFKKNNLHELLKKAIDHANKKPSFTSNHHQHH